MALDQEIEAFEKLKTELEARYSGKFVIIKDQKLQGSYDSFNNAAEDALKKFGKGPYLIRQVGAPIVTIPASVAYRVVDAVN